MSRRLRDDARRIFDAALVAVRPEFLVSRAVDENSEMRESLRRGGRIIVVGGGKAGAGMLTGLESALAHDLDRVIGSVNVPDDSIRPTQKVSLVAARPTGPNEPTAAAVRGTETAIELLESANPDDVVIALISGGGSALLVAPAQGISLDDKIRTTRLLAASGATIHELNLVRKKLSRIKGGNLIRRCAAESIWAFIISDVVGDPLDVIASGPTVDDTSTNAQAVDILKRFDLWNRVPQSVKNRLQRSDEPNVPRIHAVHNLVVGSNSMALAAAAVRAHELGYDVAHHGNTVAGDTTIVAQYFSKIVRLVRDGGSPEPRPKCIIFGGETTVALKERHGKGGRNQEFVLAMLSEFSPSAFEGLAVLSGGTDGEDGPTDAAGAVADSDTWQNAVRLELDPRQFLCRNDSYAFFEAVGGLVKTGLTGTNVMDIRIILVQE